MLQYLLQMEVSIRWIDWNIELVVADGLGYGLSR